MRAVAFFACMLVLLVANAARAQDQPCSGKCLSPDQVAKLRQAIDELDDIHKSPATVKFQDPIVVVRDWDGRVYTNGGDKQPLRLKLKIGNYVDRDLSVVVESRVWYRPEPKPPMFRLRIRAQAGILIPGIVDAVEGNKEDFVDAGISWDFFHIGIVNVAAYTGVRSAGIGPGIDLTKNFGLYAGYSIAYDGFKSNVLTAAYFSFN